MTTSKRGISAKELKKQLGQGSYVTAFAWLHKLRDAMVVPNRTPLTGHVEVDECYCGGLADGKETKGRSLLQKTLVAVAVEKDGEGCGRARLSIIADASALSLEVFVRNNVAKDSTVITDGWPGYLGITDCGYLHDAKPIKGSGLKAHVVLPRVHRVISNMKRWILGTHQRSVQPKHLQSYFDEYVFRFNRRRASNLVHGFQRLMEGAVRQQCKPYWKIVGRSAGYGKKW